MRLKRQVYIAITIFICLVWLINGLVFKVLNVIPRHQEIVARILGAEHSWLLTQMIGVAEIFMVVWIVSRIKVRPCAVIQMTVIATMNVIEFTLAPDLLLFGRMNIVLAAGFILVIWINEFILNTKSFPNTTSNADLS